MTSGSLTLPRMPDILGTREAAELAGITPTSLRTYRTRKMFPEPDGYLSNVPWWHRSTVLACLEVRRRPGRPKHPDAPPA